MPGPGITTPNSALLAANENKAGIYAGTNIPQAGVGQSEGPQPTTPPLTNNYENFSSTPYTANGSASLMDPHAILYANGTPVNGPTLGANMSTPSNLGSSINSPAVITSSAAEDDVSNMGTQIGNLNTDASNQSTALQPVVTPGNTETNNSNTTSGNAPTTPTPAAGTPAGTPASTAGTQISTGDPQVDALINSLFPTETAIGATAVAPNGETADQLSTDIQQNLGAQTASDQYYSSLLASISTGTYPLSPAETQLLNSTIATYQSSIKGLAGANQSFIGALQQTLASLGINQSAPMEAQGAIYGAISQGVSKIADLNAKMSQAVGKLQLSFQAQDFKNAQSQWTAATKLFTDRQNTLDKMATDLQTAIKQQQADFRTYITAGVSAITKSDQLSLTQKNDALTQLYRQQTLDERTRHDIQTELHANSKAITAAQTKAQAQQSLATIFTAGGGAKLNGADTIDQNGYVTPAAWKEALNTAIAAGITRQDFVTEYGGSLYAPGGKVDPSYGLSKNDLNYLPSTETLP